MPALSKLEKIKKNYRDEFDIDANNHHSHHVGLFATDTYPSEERYSVDISSPLDASTLTGFVESILYIRDCRTRSYNTGEDCCVDNYQDRLNDFLGENGLDAIAYKLVAAEAAQDAKEAAEASAKANAKAKLEAQAKSPTAQVRAAIKTLDGGKQGSSLQAIKKYIEDKAAGACNPKHVLSAIKKLVAKGELAKVKSSFRLRDSTKPGAKAAAKAKAKAKLPAAVKAGDEKAVVKTKKAVVKTKQAAIKTKQAAIKKTKAKKAAPKEPEVIDGTEHFVVESFEGVCFEERDGEATRRFKVRWQGYGPEEDCWVSERSLKEDLDKKTFTRLAAALKKR